MSDDRSVSAWTRQDAMGAVGVAAVLAAIGLVGIGPPIVEAMSRGELRKSLDQTLAEKQTIVMTAEQVQRDKEAIDHRLEQSKVTLVPLSELNHRVMELVNLGAEAGLTVAQITPGAPRSVRQCLVERLTVTGTGGYPAVSEYLGKIHVKFLDVVVAEFSVEARRTGDASSGTFVLELDWYAAPEGPDGAPK